MLFLCTRVLASFGLGVTDERLTVLAPEFLWFETFLGGHWAYSAKLLVQVRHDIIAKRELDTRLSQRELRTGIPDRDTAEQLSSGGSVEDRALVHHLVGISICRPVIVVPDKHPERSILTEKVSVVRVVLAREESEL